MAIRLHVLEGSAFEVMQHDPSCIVLWLLVAVACHDCPFAVANFIERRAVFGFFDQDADSERAGSTVFVIDVDDVSDEYFVEAGIIRPLSSYRSYNSRQPNRCCC